MIDLRIKSAGLVEVTANVTKKKKQEKVMTHPGKTVG
jgi:hypothetical protein